VYFLKTLQQRRRSVGLGVGGVGVGVGGFFGFGSWVKNGGFHILADCEYC